MKTTDAQRRGEFYLVCTEKGKKRELKVKEKAFESAIKAACAKERHVEDSADRFLVEQQMLRMRQQLRMTAKPVVGDKENSPSETGTMT